MINNVEILPANTVYGDDFNKPIMLIYLGYMGLVDASTGQVAETSYGSELAALNLASYLKQSHQIYFLTVSHSKYRVVSNDIIHTTTAQLNERPEFWMVDVLIISRYINYFLECHYKYNKLYLWIHDVCLQSAYNGMQLTDTGKHLLHNNLDKIDKIVVLSPWHLEYFRELYQISDNKLTIIGNGCGVAKITDVTTEPRRIANRFIYTSDFSRGLERLITYFLKIRSELPDATLEIFRDSKGHQALVEKYQSVPEIRFHGRVDSDRLVTEFKKSEFWFYPTEFHETYCISALEAQRYGCICIASDLAALSSTVGERGLLLPMNVVLDANQAVKRVVSLANDTEAKKKYQEKAMSWAAQQDWSHISEKWQQMIRGSRGYGAALCPKLCPKLCPTFCINLARRPDRRRQILEMFQKHGISRVHFFDAADGNDFALHRARLAQQFDGRRTRFTAGAIGCTLSHIQLWQQLVNDKHHNVYLIFEDDLRLINNFSALYEQLDILDGNFDMIQLGYHMWKRNLKEYQHIYRDPNYSVERITLAPINRELYLGGTFGMIVSKRGAQKMLDSIATKKIRDAVDLECFRTAGLEMLECQPMMAISQAYDSRIDSLDVDTDIQNGTDFFQDSTSTQLENYTFYPNLDHYGSDLFRDETLTLEEMAEKAKQTPGCVAFNTYGYFKSAANLNNLQPLPNYKYNPDGLYVRSSSAP